MGLDEAELLVERQAVGGGDEPPLPGVAVHQPLQHRTGEAAAAPVAGDDNHVEGAGRPEGRRQGGADQSVAVGGGDAAAEAEDQRPVLRAVRPALGAGERDGAVEMGGRQRLEGRGPGSRSSRHLLVGAILGEAGAQVLCRIGPAAQSRAVLDATRRRKCRGDRRGRPRGGGRSRPPPATSCRGARAIQRFLLLRAASAAVPFGGGTVKSCDARRPAGGRMGPDA